MRIFISATSDFKPASGGIAELTHQMARFLAEAGHVVEVAASKDRTDTSAWDLEQTYRVRRLAADDGRGLASAAADFAPDWILINVAGSGWASLRLAAWKRGIPLALFVHGTDVTKWKSLLSRIKTRISLALSDQIIVNSSYTGRQLGGLVHPRKPVIVFHPGLETGYGTAPADPLPPCPVDGKVRILCLCRHTERKGIDHSIRAFHRLKDEFPETVLWIAGTGSQTPFLKSLTAELRLEDRVYFWGSVDDRRKASLYAGSQLYMMPNRRLPDGDVEGFGISFLEANAYGLPVIGGIEGGSAEAVSPGVSGWLVDGADLDSVTEALRDALAHPEKRRDLGRSGRDRALAEFTYPKEVERLVVELRRVSRRLQRAE